MKGDFTRSTFRPEKHYSGVRLQQGRVQLDADWNEQIDITAHRIETEAADVMGACGAPLHAAGFALTSGAVPTVGAGRYYVDGILCEHDAPVPLDQQPDLPGMALSSLADGFYLAYLDVWQRHITALEDDSIREVALNGPDTATRTRTVWQVKLLGPFPNPITCVSEPEEWKALLDQSQNGRLSARAAESATPPGPCIVPEGAGYRRLENQLYRVEVHAVDANGNITRLKWSRDNGAIVTRWLGQEASKPEALIVASIGRDEVLRFAAGQHVEVIDEQRELRGAAGLLVRLANAEGQVLTLDTTDPNWTSVKIADFPPSVAGRPNHPKARRWDGVLANPALNTWLELEDGVQIRLSAGRYHVGDYWLIPARTVTADVEWPRDASNNPIPQPRAGIAHHYCKLAVLNRSRGIFTVAQDCRQFFPPLTRLVALLYVGGDGQEAMPGQPLPQPLRARVLNGATPVIGARVRFTVTQGGGSLTVAQPVLTTGPDGIAECGWTLGSAGSQQVTAVLLDAGDTPVPGHVLRFGANLSLARGGCCVCVGPGGDYERLDEALKDLIGRGERDICICLRPGDQEIGAIAIERNPNEPDLHLTIAGCGPGIRLTLRAPIRFVGVTSVVMRDLALDIAFPVVGAGAVTLHHCSSVEVRACQVSGLTDKDGALLLILNADRVHLEGNLFEALLPGTLAPARDLFARVQAADLANLFGLPDQGELRLSVFRQSALRAAQALVTLDPRTRREIQSALQQAWRQLAGQSQGELLSYAKLVLALAADVLRLNTIFDLLLDIRRATGKARPGTALILEEARRMDEAGLQMLQSSIDVLDQDDRYRLVDNDIAGVLSLYGPPALPSEVNELLNADIIKRLFGRLRENQIQFNAGFLGTLHLRGNQIARVAVSREIVMALQEAAMAQGRVTFPFDLFSRCPWSDNVFEGAQSLLVCRHLSMQSNEFTSAAASAGPAGAPNMTAAIIADSTIYVANHGAGEEVTLLSDSARRSDRVANQELTIAGG
jgi:hypothetical protein